MALPERSKRYSVAGYANDTNERYSVDDAGSATTASTSPSAGRGTSRSNLPSSENSATREDAFSDKRSAMCPPTIWKSSITPFCSGTTSVQPAGPGRDGSAFTMWKREAPTFVSRYSVPFQLSPVTSPSRPTASGWKSPPAAGRASRSFFAQSVDSWRNAQRLSDDKLTLRVSCIGRPSPPHTSGSFDGSSPSLWWNTCSWNTSSPGGTAPLAG